MFCSKCGAENNEGSQFCSKCGVAIAYAVAQPSTANAVQGGRVSSTVQSHPAPDSFLLQAILVTLCCCLPFGIPSIVYSSQVNAKFSSGDIDGSHESARKARFWFWWALGVGLPVQILVIIANIAAN